MDALDPRHGTSAGTAAHRRGGTEPCLPCRRAKAKADKRRRLHGSGFVDLPEDLWATVRDNSIGDLMRHTGLSECALVNIRKRQGKLRVKRSTAAALREFRPVTLVGVQRRVRALACLGWSCTQIAKVAGLHHETIAQLQRKTPRSYVSPAVRDAVLDAYRQLHMTPAPVNRHTHQACDRARLNGWLPPLAWDDIDTQPATPAWVNVRDRRDSRWSA